MKAMVISGSRCPQGHTALAMQGFRKGFEAAGGEVDEIFLPDFTLERCRQCDDNGWGLCRSEGRCVIEDDFPAIVERLKTADAAVFANPVYFGDLSESLRAFLDRVRRISFAKGDQRSFRGVRTVGICVAGGGGGGAPACCESLEKVLSTIGFDVVDMIPARRQNLNAKIKVLEMTGNWLAAELRSDAGAA